MNGAGSKAAGRGNGRARAVVADEWDIAATGMAGALESVGVVVTKCVDQARDALLAARNDPVDLVVLGKVSDIPVVRAVRQVKATPEPPKMAVLLPSTAMRGSDVYDVMAAGADALLIRSVSRRALTAAVSRVLRGERVVAPALLPLLTGQLSVPHGGAEAPVLSARERDVLNLLADGHTNRAIADALYISIDTVKTHLQRIYTKLGVRSRHDALVEAMARHLIG